MSRAYDLDQLVDDQPLRGGVVTIVIVAMCVLVSDGFDIAAMGYIAPELGRLWGLTPKDFVPAFSSGIIGLMVGGPLFGWLGDKLGRKRLILVALVIIGLMSLVTIFIRSTTDLLVLRFLTGIAMGGVIPNVAALVAELTPRRIRGRTLVLVTLGVPIGLSLPGLVAALLVPVFGWHAILLVGGLLPLLAAVLVAVRLPESIKYLLETGGRENDVRRVAAFLRPDLAIDSETIIIRSGALLATTQGSFRSLFSGPLLLVTPLLWLCQASNQMANFFALTWLPTLLQASGSSSAAAGANSALFALGGLFSGLILIAILDRLGIVPVVLLFLFGTPLVAAMAATEVSAFQHSVIIFAAGFCVTGVQLGMTALLGIFYPTPVRSTGTGWAQAAGRVGALAAPVVGGILLGMGVPIARLPLAPALAMAVGMICCILLAGVCYRALGSWRPREFAVQPA